MSPLILHDCNNCDFLIFQKNQARPFGVIFAGAYNAGQYSSSFSWLFEVGGVLTFCHSYLIPTFYRPKTTQQNFTVAKRPLYELWTYWTKQRKAKFHIYAKLCEFHWGFTTGLELMFLILLGIKFPNIYFNISSSVTSHILRALLKISVTIKN